MNGEFYVKSRNEKDKKEVFVKIKNVYNNGKQEIFDFKLEDGRKMRTTMEHKFRTTCGKMLPVKQIIDERLEIICLENCIVKIKSFENLGKLQTYDLGVDHKDHQFYLSNGILTSNSHAVAYSINGYNSAFFAHYYPSAFMAAVLKSEASKVSSPSRDANLIEYKRETKKMGINILVPDISISDKSFTVSSEKSITTGFNSIKGIGEKAINEILRVREEHPFKSFADFLYRTKSSLVRKTVIQALAKAGCFDSLDITRKNAYSYYDVIRTKANKHAKKIEMARKPWNILDDFGYDLDKKNEWSLKERLRAEQEVLGEIISGSMNDLYDGFFTNAGTLFSNIKSLPKNFGVRIEAVVTGIKTRKVGRGKSVGRMFAECSISDKNGTTIQLTVWPAPWAKFKDRLPVGRAIKAICKVNEYNGNKNLVLERIENWDG
jgi:DNA polymerase-3 subunit alpha